jgi:hypothetical protein
MRWRPGHLALVVFQAIWLNVVLPGHTRGALPLAGTDCDACLHRAEPHCCPPRQQPPQDRPTSKQKANCALCAFAARVTPPPPITAAPVPSPCSVALAESPAQVVASLDCLPTYYANGPPSAAA